MPCVHRPPTAEMCPKRCITPPPSGTPCSLRLYRPDSGMEKRLASTQNQWLLFSLLQRPPVIRSEYKAHIVARPTHTHTPHL